MTEPTLGFDKGFLWMAHTMMPAATAGLLADELQPVRHRLQTRDQRAMGDPRFETEIELWVHPGDKMFAWGVLQKFLIES